MHHNYNPEHFNLKDYTFLHGISNLFRMSIHTQPAEYVSCFNKILSGQGEQLSMD